MDEVVLLHKADANYENLKSTWANRVFMPTWNRVLHNNTDTEVEYTAFRSMSVSTGSWHSGTYGSFEKINYQDLARVKMDGFTIAGSIVPYENQYLTQRSNHVQTAYIYGFILGKNSAIQFFYL